jgi:hypothetical protein
VVGALDLNNGNENTAAGTGALLLNTTGTNNTTNGAFALIPTIAGATTRPSVLRRSVWNLEKLKGSGRYNVLKNCLSQENYRANNSLEPTN